MEQAGEAPVMASHAAGGDELHMAQCAYTPCSCGQLEMRKSELESTLPSARAQAYI